MPGEDQRQQPGHLRSTDHADREAGHDPLGDAVGADQQLTDRIAESFATRLLLELAGAARLLVTGERGPHECRDLVL